MKYKIGDTVKIKIGTGFYTGVVNYVYEDDLKNPYDVEVLSSAVPGIRVGSVICPSPDSIENKVIKLK